MDACPYIIVGRKVYDCQHGVDRHAKEKQRNQQNRVSKRQPPINGYYERKNVLHNYRGLHGKTT